ncbi:MAG: hypothetical protein Q8O94_01360, partial [bacterium]|nr:hypothetical protein [bacterium]
PAEKHEEERGRIYHEILKRDGKKDDEKAEASSKKAEPSIIEIKDEPIVTALPHKREDIPVIPEDDESWGAIPAFLRRHKK